MSFYNMIFGRNPLAGTLLAMLDLKPEDVGRLRDCYLDEQNGDLCIAVYTRNGGGNREHYDDLRDAGPDCNCTGCIIEHRLPTHSLYIADRDDDFDCTYATIWFRIPERWREACNHLAAKDPESKPDQTPDQRWQTFLERLQTAPPDDPDVKRVVEAFRPTLEAITEKLGIGKARGA